MTVIAPHGSLVLFCFVSKCMLISVVLRTYLMVYGSYCVAKFSEAILMSSTFLIRSIGLWRWYINMTITVLNIIHCPVFYLKLSSTPEVCPYLTRNTLRLRSEPNISICLWRWYINITATILDILFKARPFRGWILSPVLNLVPVDRANLLSPDTSYNTDRV
jgi:hypothetical protein